MMILNVNKSNKYNKTERGDTFAQFGVDYAFEPYSKRPENHVSRFVNIKRKTNFEDSRKSNYDDKSFALQPKTSNVLSISIEGAGGLTNTNCADNSFK